MTDSMILPSTQVIELNSVAGLELRNVETSLVDYQGRSAVRVVEATQLQSNEHAIAILPNTLFRNGVIETEIAGMPRADAPSDMRGFVGIAFRVQPHGTQFECFYLRPTNGRADDQLRRNHATQYISHSDYLWYRLREEHPGMYESYTDLVPGAWTPIRIVVSG